MTHELTLYLDRFAARSEPVTLAPVAARALYVVEGCLALRGGDGDGDDALGTRATLEANSALSLPGAGRLGGGGRPTTVLRWELTAAGAAPTPSAGADSRRLLAAPLQLDATGGYLLRCDRVDFPPGGEALKHTHQGGGIRCLLAGSIRIDTGGSSLTHGPLGAWFEAGPEPVYAAADAAVPTAFARVMILPRALLGGHSSIRYVNPEDLARPKSQRYQVFLDEPIARAR